MTKASKLSTCPCGAGARSYEECCGRYISGGESPQSAQELMRSRYTAYALCNDAYLQATWHASTCPPEDRLADPEVKWLGLEIKKHLPLGDEAEVEFVARYRVHGRAYRLHETSRFVKENSRWFYLEGRFHEKKHGTT